MMSTSKLAVITGASAGIGAATAAALADAGFELVLGARRIDALESVARPLGAKAAELDVTEAGSVEHFCSGIERCDLLVNNAGAAYGLDRIENASDEDWLAMYDLNVLGMLRVTRALLPKLRAAHGHIINLGSTSGFEVYPGGGGYTGSKHAVRAFTRTLRLELHGEPVRVSEICPGLVETEFSNVRFAGDADRAAAVYRGMEPLRADDIAEIIAFVATRPPHVDIDEVVVRPLDQATAMTVHRRDEN